MTKEKAEEISKVISELGCDFSQYLAWCRLGGINNLSVILILVPFFAAFVGCFSIAIINELSPSIKEYNDSVKEYKKLLSWREYFHREISEWFNENDGELIFINGNFYLKSGSKAKEVAFAEMLKNNQNYICVDDSEEPGSKRQRSKK